MSRRRDVSRSNAGRQCIKTRNLKHRYNRAVEAYTPFTRWSWLGELARCLLDVCLIV